MKRPQYVILPLLLPVALVIVIGLRFVAGDQQPPMSAVAWAQASSCGNAILDPGEQCDPPGSATCPSGFQACSATCTCEALDHFQCYEVKPAFFAPVTVTIDDKFGPPFQETLRLAHRLCAPTSKNNEGIVDPTDHLAGYRTKPPSFTKVLNQTLVDQFGTLKLDIVRPDILLVPSGKDGVAQVPPLDHFQCYKIKRSKGAPKFVKKTVGIANQFETVSVTVTKPYRLCTPANKNNEDPTAPSHPTQLICYKTSDGKFAQTTHVVDNQFDPMDSMTLIHRRELCVPSPPTTTTTTTSSTTTTIVVTTSTTTTSSTTTTTLYGSPSRAFLLRSVTLLD